MRYFRLSGAGNDFLALAEPARPPDAAEIRAWCHRGLSLGADGLFVLTRRPPARERARVTMSYFNADGRPAELCLNGTRCAARLAFHLGWGDDEVEIATGAGLLTARAAGPRRITLKVDPLNEPLRELTVELDGRLWEGWWVRVGVPHFVLPWEDGMAAAPVAAVGPLLRRHAAFGEAGANVDFVSYREPARLEIRTYERGVEAETLACGTGVLAGAAVGLLTRRTELPLTALTRGGFTLEVAGEGAGWGRLPRSWSLTGDARLIAEGHLTDEAARLPTPPGW